MSELTCDRSSFPDATRNKFESVVVEGYFERGFEKVAFRAVDSKEAWWAPSRVLNEAYAAATSHPLRVEIRGWLSPPGRYGHLRGYTRCLADIEIVKIVEAKGTATGN